MVGRIVVAMMLAGAGVLGALLGFVRSQAGGMQLCALAEATLRDLSRERVVIGRCEVDPLATRLLLGGVEIGPEGKPLLQAERLVAGLSTRALLSGRVRIDGVELLRPRIDADLDALPPREETPDKPGRRCLPNLGVLEVGTVALTDGALRLVTQGRTLEARGLSVSATGERTKLTIAAELGQATWTDEHGRDELDEAALRGDVDLDSGVAHVEKLDVRADFASVYATARLDDVCALKGTARGTLRADLGLLGAHLLRAVRGLEGEASVQWSAELDGARSRGEAAVDAKGIAGWGLRPGSFSAKVAVTPGELALRSLDWPMGDGVLHARGTLGLVPSLPVKLDLALERVVMGELLARVGVPDLTVHLEGTGTAAVAGTLAGEPGLDLAGDVKLAVPILGAYDRTWRERARSRQQWFQLEDGAISARYRVLPDRVELLEGRVEGRTTRGEVQGTIWYGARGMDVAWSFPRLSLADLGPFGGTACEGVGTASGTVSGAYAALDVRAEADLARIAVVETELGRARAKARLDLGARTLSVTELVGTLGPGRSDWSGALFMDFANQASRGHLELPAVHLADLAATARRYAPVMGTYDGKLDMVLTGRMELSGPPAALDARMTARVRDAIAYGTRFEGGFLKVSMEGARTYRVDQLRLVKGPGHLWMRGEYRRDGRGYAFKAHTRKLKVGDVEPLVGAMPALAGGVTLDAWGEGTLARPQAGLKLTLRDWYDGPQPLGTLRMTGSLDGQVASLEGTVASPWPAGVKPPPRAKGAPHPRPPGSFSHAFAGTATLRGDLPFTASATFDVPDLHAALKPGVLDNLEGGLRGRLEASGHMKRPGATVAELVVERMWLKQGALELETAAEARARLEAGRLSVEALPLMGTGFQLAASGVREADGRLDFAAQGSADLAALHGLFPAIEASSGGASLAVTLTGTLEEPVVVGHASVEGLSLRLRHVPAELTDLRGSVLFSPAAILTDGLEGSVNGARVALDGHVDLEQFRPRSFEMALEMSEIPFQWDDMPFVVSGRPVLRGTLDAVSLEGDVSLDRFRFERDLELEKTLVQALEVALQRRPPPVPRVFERSGEFLTLDLGLHLGDVRIDNNLLKADLRGDLRLTGTNRRPGLLGAVTFNDARAFMRNTEYDVSSGVVNFTDRTRIRPAFDVRADARVRDYLVHAAASGTAQQPRLVVSSEPPLPEADILTLLTLGVTSRDFARTDSSSLGSFLIDAAYNASGLGDQLKRLLPGTTAGLLDDADLRVTSAYSELSGNIEPVAQFEGKVRGANVKLSGQASLIGRARRAQAEIKVSDAVSGVVQVDSGNPSVPTADYGADFKWHVERP
jgi:translocation and assembly module TamB